MRDLDQFVDAYRIREGPRASTSNFGMNGAFRVPRGGVTLTVVASDGGGWDHVSVSLPTRCPTWEEMCHVKDLFFRGEECVVQYHPPRSRYVNNHAYCLHLWRPQAAELPLPPEWMVGVKGLSPADVARMARGS